MILVRSIRIVSVILIGLLALETPTAQAAEVRPRWLAIVASGLAESVQPLADRRSNEGFEVELHPVSNTDNSESLLAWVKTRVGDSSTPTFVVLVGDWYATSKDCYVPPALGQHGRMRDKRTDFPYACPNAVGSPAIAVGRLPARSSDELRAMIVKIVQFEEQELGPWSNRVNLWVGHPGGNSAIEKKLAETIVLGTIGSKLEAIPVKWNVRPLVDFPGTPYTVPRDAFASRVVRDFEHGQCFSVYAGHSGAAGFWSDGRYVVPRDRFASVRIKHSPGVFLTTGCYASALSGGDDDGYLVAGIRNPAGPAACIGAYGESYAAHGQLVIDALVRCLSSEHASSDRLAFSWLAALNGIAGGPIDPLTFWLYDQADGSRGQVPLAKQRREHLEMWTLLGDPALRIPALTPTLRVAVTRVPNDDKRLHVTTEYPAGFTTGKVYLHCDVRPTGVRSESAPALVEDNAVFEFPAEGRQFDDELELPVALENRNVVVRVILSSGTKGWLGIGETPVLAPDPAPGP